MINIGVSSCLIGKKVRFDGQSKTSEYIADTLGQLFNLIPLCPEVAIGLPVPRPALRLVTSNQAIDVVFSDNTEVSKTAELKQYAKDIQPLVDGLSGYILKKNSPSCGLASVKLYDHQQQLISRKADGIYANELVQRNPLLPVEEEGRLNDARLLESFIARVYVYHHWQQLQGKLTAKNLIDFHSRVKYLLFAFNTQQYKALGRLLSNLSGDVDAVADKYISTLMQVLQQPTTRKRHANVLFHLLGYFKRKLISDDRQFLATTICQYQQGESSLQTVVKLFQYFLSKYPNDYLQQQFYFTAFPPSLCIQANINRV